MNLCRACGQDFSSVGLFDRHRTGRHAYTFAEGLRMDPPVDDGRRCLDLSDMRSLWWEPNERGAWHDPERSAAVGETFRRRALA